MVDLAVLHSLASSQKLAHSCSKKKIHQKCITIHMLGIKKQIYFFCKVQAQLAFPKQRKHLRQQTTLPLQKIISRLFNNFFTNIHNIKAMTFTLLAKATLEYIFLVLLLRFLILMNNSKRARLTLEES